MKHEKFSEMLVLSQYGELSNEEEARLAEHLSHCSECMKERADLEKLQSFLANEDSKIPESLLWQAREELFLRIRREARKSIGHRTWADLLSPLRWDWVTVGGAVAVLSIGVLIGYLGSAPESSSPLDPFGDADVRITNLILEDTGETDGEVRLTFEATRNFRVKGNIDDQKIQRFLAYTLINEQNAGTRLRAVNTIRDQTPAGADQQIRKALVVALRRDENPAVRQQALLALQNYPFDEEIRDVLVYVLMHDQNAKLRIEAINTLEMAHSAGQPLEQEVLGALQQRFQTDQNKYIRLRAKAVLEEVEPQFF